MISPTNYLCPICGVPGRVCGDDHVTRAPISSDTIKGANVMADENKPKLELREYEYVVGHLPVRALLTEKMADRLNAKPVGETESPGTGNVDNNEAQRTSTHSREADDSGVTNPDNEDAARKARTARNKRAAG